MQIYTKEEQINLVKNNYLSIKKIKNPCEEACIISVQKNPEMLEYIKEQTKDICLQAVKEDGHTLKYVKEQTEEICLEAVKQNGIAIKYVEKQTEAICLEAVKKNAWALKYAKYQTEDMCILAVKKQPSVIEYAKYQTEEVCLEAVKRDGFHIKNIKTKTPKLCFYAFLNSYELIQYKYIKNGIVKFIEKNPILTNNTFLEFRVPISISIPKISPESISYLKEYLLRQNNNRYVLADNNDIELLKELALSDNELIIVDSGRIKDIHKILANKIIKQEDLQKEIIKGYQKDIK